MLTSSDGGTQQVCRHELFKQPTSRAALAAPGNVVLPQILREKDLVRPETPEICENMSQNTRVWRLWPFLASLGGLFR
jgi:hypothetical protein